MPKRVRENNFDELMGITDPVARENYTDPTLAGTNSTFPTAIVVEWNHQMGRPQYGRQPLRPRVLNGRNDPHSIMCLTDALLRIDHRSFITANVLVGRLEAEAPWIKWDVVTVGRILHSLSEIARENRGPAGQQPIWITSSNGMRNYIPPQDLVSWHWLGVIRERAGQIALEEAKSGGSTRDDSVWERLSAVRFGDRL